MLLPRILSALVMAAAFLVAVFVLGQLGFMIFIAAVVALGAWEWARFADIDRPQGRIAFAGMVVTLLFGIEIFQLQSNLLILAPLLWVLALYWVAIYPKSSFWSNSFVRLLFGLSILITTWCALVVLKQQAHFITWILMLMGLIWGADTGAYFAGRLFGKRKLAVHVSPGKSWEGVVGGVVLTQLGIAVFAFFQALDLMAWVVLAAIALVTVLVSVLGDLTESLFKRHAGLKDSSHLIPGHGGVLDRVDSLTSAAPIFVLLLGFAGWL